MSPKIWFRADGNVQMGLGHLVRSSALANMLRDDFEIHFVCIELDEAIEKDFIQDGFSVARINSEVEFTGMIKHGDLVVLDGYQFGTTYQQQLKSKQIGLVCIDDIMDKEFHADLIINQAPDASPENYRAQSYTEFAFGVEYCLLRKPFLDAVNQRDASESKMDTNKHPKTVFICFGGSDAQNLTASTYKSILEFKKFERIILVTGASYEHQSMLEELVALDSTTIHYHHIDAHKMAELMSESDIKIVPSSGILYEALATGGIVISGYYTDNQIPNYQAFLGMKAIIGADKFKEQSLRNAISEIDSFSPHQNIIDGKSPDAISEIDSFSQRQNIIDGKSPDRFKKVFLNLHKKTRESVRINSHQIAN